MALCEEQSLRKTANLSGVICRTKPPNFRTVRQILSVLPDSISDKKINPEKRLKTVFSGDFDEDCKYFLHIFHQICSEYKKTSI